MLNTIHPNFLAHACSAVDITHNVIVGRPYGGTDNIFRKEIAGCIRQIDIGDPRLCVVPWWVTLGPFLLYVFIRQMAQKTECIENYIDTCAPLSAILLNKKQCIQLLLVTLIHILAVTPLSFSLGFFSDNDLRLITTVWKIHKLIFMMPVMSVIDCFMF